MDAALREALEPVLHDLARTGVAEPRIEDRDWTGDADVPSAMLWSPDGTGTGVYVAGQEPAFERIAAIADQVQDWAIEEQWSDGVSTNWPRCPHHPDTHPMLARTHEETAVWVCPANDSVVVRIGTLE